MKLSFCVKNQFTTDEWLQWETLSSDDNINSMCSSISWINSTGISDGVKPNILFAYDENHHVVGGLTLDYSTDSKKVPNQYKLQSIVNGYNPFYENMTLPTIEENFDPSLVITSRGGNSCDFRYNKDFSFHQRIQLLNSLLDEIELFWKNKGGNNVSLLYVPENAKLLNKVLQHRGYISATIGARYSIPITFKTFNEFLAKCPSKLRRNIGREIRQMENLNVTLEKESMELGIDKFIELVGLNYVKYGCNDYNPTNYKKRVILISKNFKEDSFLVNMIYESKVVGSCWFIKYKDSLIASAVGLYDNLPKNLAAYFNLVYTNSIKLALELNVKYIEFGHNLDNVKLSRGCTMNKLRVYTKTNSSNIRSRFKEIDHYVETLLDSLK